ncbi:hypothetical protein LepocDRAFT_00002850 [Leptothrix ochracea L12]|uniref:Uncharacterized protein n=1 Tax=Leptothrix ochracea L12 TaxID=735332 RepID=I4Z5R1_9BURK|nr:hypothetical protein LepocDRAFT_00002850 [Leptothrix ochracea L12]
MSLSSIAMFVRMMGVQGVRVLGHALKAPASFLLSAGRSFFGLNLYARETHRQSVGYQC